MKLRLFCLFLLFFTAFPLRSLNRDVPELFSGVDQITDYQTYVILEFFFDVAFKTNILFAFLLFFRSVVLFKNWYSNVIIFYVLAVNLTSYILSVQASYIFYWDTLQHVGPERIFGNEFVLCLTLFIVVMGVWKSKRNEKFSLTLPEWGGTPADRNAKNHRNDSSTGAGFARVWARCLGKIDVGYLGRLSRWLGFPSRNLQAQARYLLLFVLPFVVLDQGVPLERVLARSETYYGANALLSFIDDVSAIFVFALSPIVFLIFFFRKVVVFGNLRSTILVCTVLAAQLLFLIPPFFVSSIDERELLGETILETVIAHVVILAVMTFLIGSDYSKARGKRYRWILKEL
ncbi:hypothetical protein [Roseibium salinum]|uniref:Uncharacterized protein n=1 Tax=Roseibium salinum TaxID=1604349 RepID=A0ABT3QY29_9HYPH|nr:hypothetical protein [Roseibium sp. DSM 29163]MCX2721836.1 hypothetical protein [Roseibium sp. DSM 29163]